MIRHSPPNVLVIDAEGADSGRIATVLAEAGIRVTTTPRAAAAMVRERFDLAIVALPQAGAIERRAVANAVRARQPGIEILSVAEVGGREATEGDADGMRSIGFVDRHFVASVRDGLLRAGRPFGDAAAEPEAELCIAGAKLACLRRRCDEAGAAGARGLAAALRREIAETVAHRQRVRQNAARTSRIGEQQASTCACA
jgi:hypothetical protein